MAFLLLPYPLTRKKKRKSKAQADLSLKTLWTIWTPILPEVVRKLQSGRGEKKRLQEAVKYPRHTLAVQAKIVVIATEWWRD